MMRILLILTLLFISSCRKEAIYEQGKYNTSIVVPLDIKLDNLKVIDWKVGPGFKTVISKGFQLTFDLPFISKDAVDDLYDKKKVNGWIVRVIKNGAKGRRSLGYLYYPIKQHKKGRMSFGGQQIKSGAVRIFYAAASMSSRFRNFQCPAFDHNLSIEDITLEAGGEAGRFLVSAAEERLIPGKVERFSLRPAIFNGEISLIGSYEIELAFFNIETKRRKSNFIKIPGRVVVKREERHVLRGCQGVTIPPREEENTKGRFKFGR